MYSDDEHLQEKMSRGLALASREAAAFIDELCRRIAAGEQDIDIDDFSNRLGLSECWDWDDIRRRIESGELTQYGIEDAIQAGLSPSRTTSERETNLGKDGT